MQMTQETNQYTRGPKILVPTRTMVEPCLTAI